jgi:hypothetical protein
MSTPGVVQPLIKPYPEGANSARTAGITVSNANAAQQTSLINTAHGGYRKKTRKFRNRKKGGASTITVPTFQVLYPETGAGTQTVNGNVTGTTQLGATSSTSSVYDSCIGQGAACTTNVQNAGKRRKTRGVKRGIKRGGVKWGCYSGGKRKSRKKITRRK